MLKELYYPSSENNDSDLLCSNYVLLVFSPEVSNKNVKRTDNLTKTMQYTDDNTVLY